MKIAIDAAPLSRGQYAGVSNYAVNVIRYLAQIDQRNIYTIFGASRKSGDLHISNDNVHIKPVPDLFSSFFTYSWLAWYYSGFPLELRFEKPDLYFSTYPALPVCGGCPRIAVVHDVTPLVLEEAFRLRFRTLFRYQVGYLGRHAARIIADSLSTKNDLIRLFNIPMDKVDVIYPAYDRDIFKPEQDRSKIGAVLKKYGISGRYLLYVGSLEPKKNIPRLIQAVAGIKRAGRLQHRLVIAGQKDWNHQVIFESVRNAGLQEEVIFTGYVSQAELPLLMGGAELFVFPSLHEGFGIPPLEAMACGVPVVSSNVASLPEVAGDAAILVDPCDVDGLAAAISRVLSDEDLRRSMRAKGLERAAMFSWEGTARRLLDLFVSLSGQQQ